MVLLRIKLLLLLYNLDGLNRCFVLLSHADSEVIWTSREFPTEISTDFVDIIAFIGLLLLIRFEFA